MIAELHRTARIIEILHKACLCTYTVKPVSKIFKNRQNRDINPNGSLMKVKSIAECSLGAFCNTFDLH